MSDERRRTLRGFALLTIGTGWLLGAPTSGRAQTGAGRDSLPARAGSYALEAGVGANSTSLGLLRFFSPRAALGLTFSGGVGHQSGSTAYSSTDSDNESVSLNLGYRRYGRLRDHLAAYGTVGLTTGYTHYRNDQVNTTAQGTYIDLSRESYGSVGGFGEIGATYLVLPHLAINGSVLGSVTGTFTHSANEQSGPGGASGVANRLTGFGASLGPVRLGLTLFL